MRNKFLLFIVILGLFLRLINLENWFHFEMDEEVIAWKLRPFLQEGRPFLIGGGTPLGFHLGPAFYYLSAIPLWFSRLDPIGWGVAAAIFGAVTVWLMWLAGKNLYGRRVGLMAALLWATGFTTVASDRHWWPLVLDPISALIVILCLYKICVIPAKAGIYTNNLYRSRVPPSLAVRLQELFVHGSRGAGRRAGKPGMTWVILGLVLAFGWQADLTVLPLFLASAAAAVMVWREQKKGIMAAIAILLVSVLPLVLFELRHPGENLGKFLQSLQRSNLYSLQRLDLYTLWFIPQSLSRLLFPITNFDGNLLKFYSWCKEIADGRVSGQPWWAGAIATVLLMFPFLSVIPAKAGIYLNRFRIKSGMTGNSESDLVLRIVILSGVGGILLFKLTGGNLYDFYLAVLYPVVLILAARSIDFIWRKWGKVVAVTALLVIVGLNLLVVARAYHPQGLAVKRLAVKWAASQVGGGDFELDSMSGCSRYNGVRYLFFLENMEPVKSFADQDLSWLYPKREKEVLAAELLVIFVTPDDLTENDVERYDQLKFSSIAENQFGDLEVLIQESQ